MFASLVHNKTKTVRILNALLCLGAACLLLAVVPPLVAQTEEPQSSADYAFGQVMNFHLAPDDPATVSKVTLFFRAPEFENTFVAEAPLANGKSHYPVDLNQVRLAPFTTVTYWWRVENKDGSILTTPEQQIAYVDDQFEWQSLTQDEVTAHWTGEDVALGQLALDVAAEAQPALAALIPNAPTTGYEVYIYPSSADLRAALRLTGRDWVGAHAHPELGVLLVTAVNSRTAASDLRQSIPHELVHFYLYQVLGAGYESLPRWFNEGLATLAESNPNPNYARVLETAVANQSTIPFAQLCENFPLAENQAVLAYAQSYSLLAYIQDRYGNSGVQNLIAAYANGGDCESGVQQALGLTLVELEQAWRQTQQTRSPAAQFFSDSGIWLLLLAGGFVIAALLVIKT